MINCYFMATIRGQDLISYSKEEGSTEYEIIRKRIDSKYYYVSLFTEFDEIEVTNTLIYRKSQ